MKKIKKLFFIFIFLLLSMYYTNKSIDILRKSDPIMKNIKDTNKKYKIDPINAVIDGKEITSGTYGRKIDYTKSYNRMKKYGSYNESLTVFKEVRPTISIENNYNKYLVKGNPNKRNISLVFKLTESKNIDDLLTMLEKYNAQVTFFIDGTLLEKDKSTIRKLSNHEIEVLSYDNKIEKVLMETTMSYLESSTNRQAKYCYTEVDNEDLLKICKSNKMHTIKPSLVLENDIYKKIKQEVTKGMVITMDKYDLDDLSSSIKYLKAKGYHLVTIDDLFTEK